jgi:hypothetical protein
MQLYLLPEQAKKRSGADGGKALLDQVVQLKQSLDAPHSDSQADGPKSGGLQKLWYSRNPLPFRALAEDMSLCAVDTDLLHISELPSKDLAAYHLAPGAFAFVDSGARKAKKQKKERNEDEEFAHQERKRAKREGETEEERVARKEKRKDKKKQQKSLG